MRLIFDENMPVSLAKVLSEHECSSVIRLGWRGIRNGDLLKRAEAAGFDVLVTLDSDIDLEQNMAGRRISLLVLKPKGQGKRAVDTLSGRIRSALQTIRTGEICVVAHPDSGKRD